MLQWHDDDLHENVDEGGEWKEYLLDNSLQDRIFRQDT